MVAGDEVTLETENGAAVIAQIAPRKNVFVRPPVANLDVLFLVASTTQPTPSTLVLDKLSAIAVDKGVQPVIVCTKGDLAEAEFLRSAYEKSTLPFIRIDYETGAGLDEIKQWITGRLCAFCGNSGVGKSTLLKTIAGVYKPSKGKVTVNGTIAPLIELGAGFDMDLTARENIYLNGTVLGFSPKYLDEKFDEIVEFSELQNFLDVPLKNYSSGMVARIGFAIATITKPDILIADEVLSVGDFLFQQKCEKRMKELMAGGTTVILVSHSIEQIERMCSKVAWLSHGRLRMNGDTQTVCNAYKAVQRGEA